MFTEPNTFGILLLACLFETMFLFLFLFQTVTKYKPQLEDDPIVRAHLDTLYQNLLEDNLCRIIEPFSRVQVSTCRHIDGASFTKALKLILFYNFWHRQI